MNSDVQTTGLSSRAFYGLTASTFLICSTVVGGGLAFGIISLLGNCHVIAETMAFLNFKASIALVSGTAFLELLILCGTGLVVYLRIRVPKETSILKDPFAEIDREENDVEYAVPEIVKSIGRSDVLRDPFADRDRESNTEHVGEIVERIVPPDVMAAAPIPSFIEEPRSGSIQPPAIPKVKAANKCESQAGDEILNLIGEVTISPFKPPDALKKTIKIDIPQEDINKPDAKGRTPIFKALGDPQRVSAYLEAGADVHHKDHLGATPLHYASNPATVNLLLDRGADQKAQDDDGDTPLHYAIRNLQQIKGIEALLQRSPEAVNIPNKKGQTPIFDALELKEEARFLLLLDNGADVEHRDSWDAFPLYNAVCQHIHFKFIEWLIIYGADIHAQHLGAESVFYCKEKESKVAKMLRGEITRLEIASLRLSTAIYYLDYKTAARIIKFFPEVLKHPIENSGITYDTPLAFATTQGNEEMIRLLTT